MEKEAEEKAVMELKVEVQRVKILIEESVKVEDENDDELEEWLIDSAIGTVRAVKELKEIRSDGGLKILRNLGFQPPPKEFLCPISHRVMEDPVVGGVTGLSYERRSIEKWVLDGNRKWPDSDQELGAVSLIPNYLLKKFILQWCENPFFREEFEEDGDGVERFYGLIIPNTNEPPQQFLCPICRNLMVNPVLAASGQTFDEHCIAKWLEEGNTKCPKTDQLLPHTLLIPNLSIKSIIHKWRTRLVPQGDDDDGGGDDEPLVGAANRDHLIDTIAQLPSLTTTSEQLLLLKDLRLLTARLPSFRALFAQVDGATSMLLHPFLIKVYKSDASLYNEAVAILMNISAEDSNTRKIVQDCPSLITFLVEALKFPDSIDTRCYAAAALGQLSFDDSNSLTIGASDVFCLLTRLLEVGHPIASREAASAVRSLCSMPQNRERFFLSGGLHSFVEKLDDPALADVILELLASIASHPMTVNAVMDLALLPLLFRMMEETKSKRDEENCIVVIFPVGQTRIGELEKVKDGARILYHVSNEGRSDRARRKAAILLSRMKAKAPMRRDLIWVLQ